MRCWFAMLLRAAMCVESKCCCEGKGTILSMVYEPEGTACIMSSLWVIHEQKAKNFKSIKSISLSRCRETSPYLLLPLVIYEISPLGVL